MKSRKKEIYLKGVNGKEKSIKEILQEVSEDICDNYCKFRDTADDEHLCSELRAGRKCPLDILN